MHLFQRQKLFHKKTKNKNKKKRLLAYFQWPQGGSQALKLRGMMMECAEIANVISGLFRCIEVLREIVI